MENSNEKIINKVIEVSNDDILPNRFQPRKYFDEAETLELAESIKEHGILQPVVVRKIGDKYEIIAGERRFKANILAGNDTVPVIVNNLDDQNSSEIAVIENVQRQNLTPIEEAISYKRILDMGYITQEELAKKVGRSQSAIANKIRLLKLSDNVQEALMEKKISERHARSLLKLEDLKKQDELLDKIIKERLTVRKTDEEIKKMNNEVNMNNTSTNNPIFTNPFMETPSTNPEPVGVVNNQLNQEPVYQPEQVQTSVVEQPNNFDIFTNQMNSNPQPMQAVEQVVPTPSIPEVQEVPQVEQPSLNIFDQVQQPVDLNQSFQPVGMDMPFNNSVQPEPMAQTLDDDNNDDSGSQDIYRFNPTLDASINNSAFMNQPIQTSETPVVDMGMFGATQTPSSVINSAPTMDTGIPTQPINQDIPLENTFNNPISMEVPNQVSTGIDIPLNETPNPMFNQVEETPSIEVPSFTPEQPVDTNIGMATPVVDLNQTIEPTPTVADIPLNETPQQANYTQPEPIIVTDNDNQFDPVMPAQEQAPTIDFKTIINLIRQCSQTIEKCGYRIDSEEYDLEDKYQVTFTIEK